MKNNADENYAASALQLLLGREAEPYRFNGMEWDRLLRLCKSNGVLVRVGLAIEKMNIDPPAFFSESVKQEQQRVKDQITIIKQISRTCSKEGIDLIFAKALHHYPDAGHDIDLFLPRHSSTVDIRIVEGLRASRRKRSLGNRIAGTINYAIAGCESLLEIHHGRIGYLGEDSSYIKRLIENGRRVEMEGQALLVPSIEDQIVLQAMQKVYGRLYIRLSDIVFTICALRLSELNWSYIINCSKRLGSFWGLCCYLDYVDQVHLKHLGSSVIPPPLRKRLVSDSWGRLAFRNGFYRFSGARVFTKAYIKKFRALVLSGNFKSASRMFMLPVIALSKGLLKIKQTAFN